jgi:membrane-associated phospholipid phosphatase
LQAALWLGACLLLALPYVKLHPAPFAAVTHAHELLSVERGLGIAVELPVQRFVAGAGLTSFFTWLYASSQFVVTWTTILLLVFVCRRAYALARDLVFVTWALSLLVFWLWPVAPPRQAGAGILLLSSSAYVHAPYDSFAAMPSLHVACAVAVALAVRCALPVRLKLVRLAVWLWPALIVFTILATGNHYLLDAAAGAALALIVNRARTVVRRAFV